MAIRYWDSIKAAAIKEVKAKFSSETEILRHAGDMAFIGFVERLTGEPHVVDSASRILWERVLPKAVQEIERTDIRCWGRLAEIAPNAFPAWVKKGPCALHMGDKGWYFEKL
jgi:hypothetical protein